MTTWQSRWTQQKTASGEAAPTDDDQAAIDQAELDRYRAERRAAHRRAEWRWAAFFAAAFAVLVLYESGTQAYLLRPGVACFQRGQYAAAERDLRLYLRFQNDALAHYYLGRTLLAEGRPLEARQQFLQDVGRGAAGGSRLNRRSLHYMAIP